MPYTTPDGAVFPYSPENCPRHRLFGRTVNGHYEVRCSLCYASFKRIDSQSQRELKKLKTKERKVGS